MPSEIQTVRKNVAVQMSDQAFNGKYLISVIKFSTGFKRAGDSLRTYGGAAVWLFREFVNIPALSAIEARLTLSSNEAYRLERIIIDYAVVVYHLLRRYATDAVTTSSD